MPNNTKWWKKRLPDLVFGLSILAIGLLIHFSLKLYLPIKYGMLAGDSGEIATYISAMFSILMLILYYEWKNRREIHVSHNDFHERLETKIEELSGRIQTLKIGASYIFLEEALHTTNGNFESWLDAINNTPSIKLAEIISKILSTKLQYDFKDENKLYIYEQTFALHTRLFEHLCGLASTVSTTIVMSPRKWFNNLANLAGEQWREYEKIHRHVKVPELDNFLILSKDCDKRTAHKLYPPHYIAFLQEELSNRQRLFILEDEMWHETIDKNYKGYLDKFMRPCKKLVDTIFINWTIFNNVLQSDSGIECGVINNEWLTKTSETMNIEFSKYDFSIFNRSVVVAWPQGVISDTDDNDANLVEKRIDEIEVTRSDYAQRIELFISSVVNECKKKDFQERDRLGIYTYEELLSTQIK